jgi:PhnB protein
MTVNPIPDGYHTVTPYLIVPDVAGMIDFLQQVFDAPVNERMDAPDGRILHAAVRIGDSAVMMGESSEEYPSLQMMLYIYLEDCEAAYRRALAAGATSIQEPKDEFYGDRVAAVRDMFGNQWWIATHIEDVTAEEMERRMDIQVRQGYAG